MGKILGSWSGMRKYFWGLLYALILTAFTAYVLLDTFVITKSYVTVTPSGSQTEESIENISPAVITETSYSDNNITITLSEYREYDTNIYVADIKLSSPEYLKAAFAHNVFGKNVNATTSETAEANNAILAINGDFYGVREAGYVLRNGTLYRNTVGEFKEDLVIYEDGTFGIISESEISAESLLEKGAEHVFSFGPALIIDGELSVTARDEVGQAMASNPRTAIGIIDDLHYVFVVSDGRTSDNFGLRLHMLAKFMQSLGVHTAYNLDGGGSSTMYFNGRMINSPMSHMGEAKERSVSDIVYIGY